MQPAQLRPADLCKRDSSLEFHAKFDFLTVIAAHTVQNEDFPASDNNNPTIITLNSKGYSIM
jgi:hypothetical protein